MKPGEDAEEAVTRAVQEVLGTSNIPKILSATGCWICRYDEELDKTITAAITNGGILVIVHSE